MILELELDLSPSSTLSELPDLEQVAKCSKPQSPQLYNRAMTESNSQGCCEH